MGLSARDYRKAILHLEIIRRTAEMELIQADKRLQSWKMPTSTVESLEFHLSEVRKIFDAR